MLEDTSVRKKFPPQISSIDIVPTLKREKMVVSSYV